MTIKETPLNNAAATATDPPVVTPATPAEVVARLRALRQLIPEFALLPQKERQSITPAASIDPAFVTASINATGVSPLLESMLGSTQPELRQEADDAVYWTEAEEELRSLLEGVATGNKVRRHRIGKAALDTYAISQRLVTRPEHAVLLPHVAAMKRLGNFGRAKAKPPQTPPAPVTTVVPQPKP